MAYRIAVLADIHSNADALSLALADAQAATPDLTVILGDLLTFGMQPNSVLSQMDDFAAQNPSVVFISGNHDAFYFGLETGDAGFYDRVPQFVRDSVYWTQKRISREPLLSGRYPWVEAYSVREVFFAHANPYAYGDWRYVSDVASQLEAANALRISGHKVGVFGHSHRAFSVVVYGEKVQPLSQRKWWDIADDAIVLINPGAVGMPRGTGLSYALLDFDDSRVRVDIRNIPSGFDTYRQALAASDLSQDTRARLLSYLES
ncbi:MAG: metallophosphoesterase family protein [Dinoroseobacter sp.]|nr:metallophosphoesterase family protein [Dinoroseobacter sp.]